jgi:transcriptional regulator with XRE-family HTH domain
VRKAFGEKIRELRRARNISGVQLSKALGISQAAISKIENGAIKPSLDLVARISKALKLSASDKLELELLTSNYLRDFDRWAFEESDQYHLYQRKIGEAEKKAQTYSTFVWNVIPGLLQTREYTAANHEGINLDPKRLEAVLGAWAERQKILSDKKCSFKFLMAEQALYTLTCSLDTHNTQLDKIQSLLEMSPQNLECRILPRDARVVLFPNVNFIICDDKFVLMDEQYQTQTIWYKGQIEAYLALFEDIWHRASGSRDSQRMISQAKSHFLQK